MIQVTPTVVLDPAAVSERFVRASGPGGQNVNKVATAVELRCDLTVLDWPEPLKARLRSLAGTRLTADDVVVIHAREHRTQAQNREAAMDRLLELIRAAARRPRTRRKTRPTAAARKRRLEAKRHRSDLKKRRGRPGDD